MPVEADMYDKIVDAILGLPVTNLSSLSAGEDLYEPYVWSLVLEAAERMGANITLLDRNGNPPASFWFRTQPSGIASVAHPYCHATIEFSDCPILEAHVGIYVSGRSKVKHECDVAVLFKSEADACRDNNAHPRFSKAILTVECKFYVDATVGVGHGRSFLGLINDIQNGERYFVATRASNSVSKLFSKHNKEYELGLSPLSPDLETRLRGSFEKAFRDFKSEFA
ncbi:hypothetical protein [Rhizobium ruizarguesonis]|uniref:hypothetical protein n=1 Tax=Rhizobium ruizarguesonis TaxID=2081791 RepID=UPI0010310C9E|nr:hypothetical protein [Rhizobium ruizarguesonis]TBA63794.1 hypothetical protein ELH57_08895 [Rhizobium ruizarguesonis]